ncbi:MAG: hypothetical protein F6K14_28470 [Symploca sp. SIO2C1]|nr:hypothetical protein [Symploca sp. SIO2C1]
MSNELRNFCQILFPSTSYLLPRLLPPASEPPASCFLRATVNFTSPPNTGEYFVGFHFVPPNLQPTVLGVARH